MQTRTVAILLFPGVELLDFAGPFEVFSAARIDPADRERLMEVFTVAEALEPIKCNNPLTVLPDYTLENCPPADILVVPGGMGTRTAIESAVRTTDSKRPSHASVAITGGCSHRITQCM